MSSSSFAQKIASKAPQLMDKALKGDPAAISSLALLGFLVAIEAVKEHKKGNPPVQIDSQKGCDV